MKKNIVLLISLLFLPVVASADSIYYVNNKGVEMTKEEYDLLINYYDESYIQNISQQRFDVAMNLDYSKRRIDTKIYKTMIHVDMYGNVDSAISVELDNESDIANDPAPAVSCGNLCWQTTYKKLKMMVDTPNGELFSGQVIITNEWLLMPDVRSYDVIAFRTSLPITLDPNQDIIGYQHYGLSGSVLTNTYSYELSGANTKTSKYGVGLSMNLDNQATALKNELIVSYKYDNGNTYGWINSTISATYQHSHADITRAQSQNYTFSAGGYGDVLAFSSSVASYFDNMQGVKYNGA